MVAAGVAEIKVRSVLTCDSRFGTCARCYGRSLATSKLVDIGEAVGINFISSKDRATFIRGLESCEDGDYFERGLEIAIDRDGLHVLPLDITDLFAVEVDFEEDLSRANQHL